MNSRNEESREKNDERHNKDSIYFKANAPLKIFKNSVCCYHILHACIFLMLLLHMRKLIYMTFKIYIDRICNDGHRYWEKQFHSSFLCYIKKCSSATLNFFTLIKI